MATRKILGSSDIKTSKSNLNQMVDVVEECISGSTTRKAYQVFVTGGVGPGVTSSLFQTVYDQDFSLQTSNPVLDMTIGLFEDSDTVVSCSTGTDTAGKMLFPSNSLMMREKVNIYKQYAQLLLGNASSRFTAPYRNATVSDNIDEALFISFKRLFARDSIKRDSFAMRFYTSASEATLESDMKNVDITSESGSMIYTDVGSSVNIMSSFGGEVGNVVKATATGQSVGLLFYQQGIAVFDLKKITSGSQKMSGSIPAVTKEIVNGVAGRACIGSRETPGSNPNAKFIPDFLTSGSIDTIVDHLAMTRFQSGSNTGITFQNITKINSTLAFCRATADEFNYSSNPTYVGTDNSIQVIDLAQTGERAFSYVTGVGLYNANGDLLAVAKLSRPVEKNDAKDLTIRVRLDF